MLTYGDETEESAEGAIDSYKGMVNFWNGKMPGLSLQKAVMYLMML